MNHSDTINHLLEIKKLLTHNLERIHACKDHISQEGYDFGVNHYVLKIAAMDEAISAVDLMANPYLAPMNEAAAIFQGPVDAR